MNPVELRNLDDLGVYITSKNHENIISHCVRNVLQVFPEAELIDVGSDDDTIKLAKKEGITVRTCGNINGKAYTNLKNEVGRNHRWIFWIDADEIYPVHCLRKIKKKIANPVFDSINVLWRVLKIKNDRIYVTKPDPTLLSKGSAFQSAFFEFRRSWPREIEAPLFHYAKKEPRRLPEVFCWHAVLFKLSRKKEATARRKKREVKEGLYTRRYEWIELKRLPWKEDNIGKFKWNTT